MKRVIVLYGTPDDPAAFDRHYAEVHTPLAAAMPKLAGFEVSRGPVAASPDSDTPYLVATLSYASDEDMAASLGSPEGQAAVADLANFATGGVRLLTIDVQTVL
jgi:uncharacterized protein (TIGR02118 family)